MEKIVIFELTLVALVGLLLYGSRLYPVIDKFFPRLTRRSKNEDLKLGHSKTNKS